MKKRNNWIMKLMALTLTASMSLEPVWMLGAEEQTVIEENAVDEENFCSEEETQETEPDEEITADEDIILDEDITPDEMSEEQDNGEEQILEEAYGNEENTAENNAEAEYASETLVQSENVQEQSKVTLYALNPGITAISIPGEMRTSYQIPISDNGEKASYRVTAGDGVTVDENGVVTPKLRKVTVISMGSGSSYVREEYSFGENTIEVSQGDQKWSVTIEVADYSGYYARKKMDDYIAANIPDSWSEYDKVKAVCEWISNNFNYSANYSSSTSLMIYGAGDCWANTAAVNYMCEKMGIKAYYRYAANDPGAGSGHRNTIAIIDGEKYIVDCGYTGDAPRYYVLQKMNSDYSLRRQQDGTWKIVQYEGTDPNVVVPETIDGKAVTAIGKMAFANAVIEVESVTLPDSITTLEDNAFFDCGKLKSIRIPKNVSSIGERLTGGNYQGDALKEIQVDPENSYFSSKDGVLFNKAGTELLAFPSGRGGTYQVPDGTTQIGAYAFYYNRDIAEITLPKTVKTIKTGAFGDCSNLSSLKLQEGLETIEDYAFANTTKPECITVPASVTKIGDYAFRYGATRIKVLGKNTQFGNQVLTGATGTMIAAQEGSTAESYAKENGHSFVKMNQDGSVPMDASWFEDIAGLYIYNGGEAKPAVRIRKDAPALNSLKDYEVSYRNNINAGTASVIITGKGVFSGEAEKTFSIKTKDMSYFREVYFSDHAGTSLRLEETGEALEPDIYIPGMEKGKDYEVSYSDNIKPGTAKAVVTWIGNYTGQRTLTFFINKKATGKKPQSESTGSGTAGTGYESTGYDSAGYDEAEWEEAEDNLPAGSVQMQWRVQIKKNNLVYNGKAQKPKVTVKWNGKTVKSSAYKLTYKNNKKAGFATVTATGKGEYKGYKATAVFQIQPQKTSFGKAKGGKKNISLKWKKNSQASGYEIQYATDKKFSRNAGTLEVGKGTKTSAVIRNLAGKKTYYVRIRAYKKAGTTCIYGKWCKSRKVKTK